GDVVVLRHPFQQDLLVVKRALERREGGWWVRGDNTYAGGDSTDYGTVPDELVLGRVRFRYRPRRAAERYPLALVVCALSAAGPPCRESAAAGIAGTTLQQGTSTQIPGRMRRSWCWEGSASGTGPALPRSAPRWRWWSGRSPPPGPCCPPARSPGACGRGRRP